MWLTETVEAGGLAGESPLETDGEFEPDTAGVEFKEAVEEEVGGEMGVLSCRDSELLSRVAGGCVPAVLTPLVADEEEEELCGASPSLPQPLLGHWLTLIESPSGMSPTLSFLNPSSSTSPQATSDFSSSRFSPPRFVAPTSSFTSRSRLPMLSFSTEGDSLSKTESSDIGSPFDPSLFDFVSGTAVVAVGVVCSLECVGLGVVGREEGGEEKTLVLLLVLACLLFSTAAAGSPSQWVYT